MCVVCVCVECPPLFFLGTPSTSTVRCSVLEALCVRANCDRSGSQLVAFLVRLWDTGALGGQRRDLSGGLHHGPRSTDDRPATRREQPPEHAVPGTYNRAGARPPAVAAKNITRIFCEISEK